MEADYGMCFGIIVSVTLASGSCPSCLFVLEMPFLYSSIVRTCFNYLCLENDTGRVSRPMWGLLVLKEIFSDEFS